MKHIRYFLIGMFWIALFLSVIDIFIIYPHVIMVAMLACVAYLIDIYMEHDDDDDDGPDGHYS